MSPPKAVRGLLIKAGLLRRAVYISRHLRPQTLRNFLNGVQFYRDLLPPGALCFDVGANLGTEI